MPRPRKHATDSDKYKAYRANKAARIDAQIQIAKEAEALVDAAKLAGIIFGPKKSTREALVYLRDYVSSGGASVWRHEIELKK